MASQIERARAFAARHRAGPLLFLPNVWDAPSARLFAEAGFTALATTSSGVAWALGYPDGEIAPWSDVVAATARIVRAAGPDVAVTADIVGAYGATPAEVGAHIGEILQTGVVGVNLEDSEGHRLRPVADAARRIAAARAAADAAAVPLFINARVDSWIRLPKGADIAADAVQRARAYLDAGADGIYPFALADAEAIAAFVQEIPAPVNILGGHGAPPAAELTRLGVRRLTIGGGAALAGAAAVQRLAQALHSAQDAGPLADASAGLGYMDMQRFFTA